MIKEWLVSNFEKQRHQVEAEAALPDLSGNVEAIHRLRVGIKQVRALFKLLSWLAPKTFCAKEAFAELRGIFKAMGRVRDIQVLEGLLKNYEEKNGSWYAGLGLLLDQRRRAAQAELPAALDDFAPQNMFQTQLLMEEGLKPLDDEKLLKQAHSKLKKRFAKVARALPTAAKDAEILHDVRTWLKECLYVMEMLNKASGREVWPKALVEELFWTAREAGEWHDREILESFLKGLDLSEAPFLDRPPYDSLVANLTQEVKDRTVKLIQRIEVFLRDFDKAPFQALAEPK